MKQLVFFLEEPSAKEMLKGVLPKILPPDVEPLFIVFQGKQDLEKRMPIRLKAWQNRHSLFVVMRDQDQGDCKLIKQRLEDICKDSGRSDVLIRIACHELESFYLGDLAAVANSIGPAKLVRYQGTEKFRDPDRLSNPVQELKRLAPEYQKVSGSRAIGLLLRTENNCSRSFNALLSGVRRLVNEGGSD